MVTIFDVQAGELINRLKEDLKKYPEIKPPEWARFVKTGIHKERTPQQKDWWYIRTASILRNLYKHSPVGVQRLRTKYGGRQNRGVRPEKFKKGSGNIVRKILQQLESAGLVKKGEGKKKGRIITPKGKSLLDKTSAKILSEKT